MIETGPMSTPPHPEASSAEFKGERSPASLPDTPEAACTQAASIQSAGLRVESVVESVDMAFLLQMSDALNTTLDLNTLLDRASELVRSIIPYRIFAILLLSERDRELRMRFQIGHSPEVVRMRFPIGSGVIGEVARSHQPMLVNDTATCEHYIGTNPDVRSELAVPLIVKNRLIGVLDIESEQADYFRPQHLHLLTIIASRIAQAIENARLYTRVSRQAQTLTMLNEIATELTSILDLEPLFERVGLLLRRIIDYQMFAVLLLDDTEETLVARYIWRFGNRQAANGRIPITNGLVGAAVREWRIINIPDVRKDPRYIANNPETRSEMIVPLFHKGHIIGVLDLEHTRTGYFHKEHEHMLTTLAAQIAIAIENARLYQKLSRHEHQLQRDISMAREVQLRLLPAKVPTLRNAELAARFVPARTIGGDLYDFLDYGTQQTAIVLGDVSGKAAPAALFAALVSGLLRSALPQFLSPAMMLAQLNDALQERRLESQYVTMLFALWKDAERTLLLGNAGAVQPMFCRNRKVTTLRAEGFPLGLFAGADYEEFALTTLPGDVLVFASDGIFDAENLHGEMYGTDRLGTLLASHAQESANELADAILADVSRFQSGKERFDDETLVVLKVL